MKRLFFLALILLVQSFGFSQTIRYNGSTRLTQYTDSMTVEKLIKAHSGLWLQQSGNLGVLLYDDASALGLSVTGGLFPATTGIYDLGSSTKKWDTVYANVINASGIIGGGETNTASNMAGAGVGVWKDKSTYDLRFKRLKAIGSNLTIADATDSVTFTPSPKPTFDSLDITSSGAGATLRMKNLGDAELRINGHFIPSITNTDDIGTALLKWRQIYSGKVYADYNATFTDRNALVTTNRLDTTAHSGIYYNMYALMYARGDSGLTFTGNGGLYSKAIEDTTNNGSNGRKRGVLLGAVLSVQPYTENAVYTSNRDATGLIVDNQGTVQGTEAIYLGGSAHKPATATNTLGYDWINAIAISDTQQAGLKFNSDAASNVMVDLSAGLLIGSNPRAIKTASTHQSDLGTLTLGGATLDSTLSITGGMNLSRGLNMPAGKITTSHTESTAGTTQDAISFTVNRNPSGTDNGLGRVFALATSNSANAQTFNGAQTLHALEGSARHQGTATMTGASSGYFDTRCTSTGTLTNAYGVNARVLSLSAGSIITNAFGVYSIINSNNATSSITTGYAFYADAGVKTGTYTNSYAFYNAGANDSNYFAGSTRFGGSMTGSSVMRGSDAFTTTATDDTVTISGAATSDFYYVQATGTGALVLSDEMKIEALSGKLAVHRGVAGTSGLTYNWFRIK